MYIGFSTNGIPNITGSLILNIAIGVDNFATVLYSFLLLKRYIAKINAIVIPEPPICRYASNDPLVHI